MWHKAPCSSRDYSGVRESGPRKIDENGDDDGDVGEDDHRGDGSPSGTPAPPGKRGESLPLVLPHPCPRGWGEVLPLVLGLHGDDGPLRDPPPWPPMMMAPFGREPRN